MKKKLTPGPIPWQRPAQWAGPPSSSVDVWPEGKMPGTGAKEPEADMPSKGDSFQRSSARRRLSQGQCLQF